MDLESLIKVLRMVQDGCNVSHVGSSKTISTHYTPLELSVFMHRDCGISKPFDMISDIINEGLVKKVHANERLGIVVRITIKGIEFLEQHKSLIVQSTKSLILKSPKESSIKPSLSWNGKGLRVLSEELWQVGYINKAKDFENVFKNQSVCVWLKGAAPLAYIIEQLYDKDFILVNNEKPNAFFKVAELYFGDNSINVAKMSPLRKALYKFKNKPSKSHASIKGKIDSMISNISDK